MACSSPDQDFIAAVKDGVIDVLEGGLARSIKKSKPHSYSSLL